MSLNYRTPLEEFSLRLEPGEQLQIRENATKSFMSKEVNILSEHFNFHLKTPQKKWLTDRGVELSVYPNAMHSHPACKVLENHLLYRVVPDMLRGQENLSFLTIKDRKLEKVKKLFRGGDEIKTAINRLVTARDFTRYGQRPSPERMDLERGGTYFIHDELHYWTMGQIKDFLDIYEPVRVVATFVYPVEILYNYHTSLNPKIYTFEVDGEELIFSPDGVITESYVQPVSAGQILSLHSLKTKKHMYSVELEYTIGAHHVLVFSRNDQDTVLHQKHRFFGPFSCVDASDLFDDSGRVPLMGIEVDVLQKIVLYLFSLKKPDAHSAVAKLRQMMAEDVDLDSMWVVRDLANRIAKFSTSWCNGSCLTVLRDWFADMLPKKVGSYRIKMLDDFDRNLMKLRPLNFHMITETNHTDWVRVAQVYLHSWLNPSGHRGCPYESWVLFKDVLGPGGRVHKVRLDMKQRVYEHSLYNWRNWYHSGAYKTRRGAVEYGPDRYGGVVPYGDFGDKMLKLALDTLNEISKAREEERRVNQIWVALMEFLYEGGMRKQVPSNQGAPASRAEKNTNQAEVESASEAHRRDRETPPPESDSSSEGGTEAQQEDDEWDDDDRAPLAKIPQCATTHSLIKAYTKDRVDLYRLVGEPVNFETKGWQRLGKRRARFFSTTKDLAYFHDKVVYQTYEPDTALFDLMQCMSRSFGVEFNTALVQEYLEGGIPKHRDDEDCYDGDDIVTVNLHGTARFSTWVNKEKDVFHLKHGDVLVMKKDSREIRHEVSQTSRGRLSITFRRQPRQICFQKAFKASEGTRCLLNAFAAGTKEDQETFCKAFETEMYRSISQDGLSDLDAQAICSTLGIAITMVDNSGAVRIGEGEPQFAIRHSDHHFELMEEKDKGSTNSKVGDDDDRKSSRELADLLLKLLGDSDGFTTKGEYKAESIRAKKLAQSLMSGSTGVNCKYVDEGFRIIPGAANDSDAKSALENLGNNLSMPVTTITGFAGSGKSYKLQQILRDNPILRKGSLIISPRVRLADDWKAKVEGLPVCTFESALKRDRRKYHTIILDEVTLFPPGYVDLLIYTDFRAKSMDKSYMVVGDPLQAAYYCDTDNLKLGAETFFSSFDVKELQYGMRTHRLSKKVAKALSVHTFSKQAGDKSLKVCPDLPTAKQHLGAAPEVILVPSRICKNRFSGFNCITYGESQGLTFKRGCVYLNEDSRLCSDHHIMVALTRFKEEVCFIYDAKGSLPLYKSNCRGLLGRLLSGQTITGAFYEGMAAPKIKFNGIIEGSGRDSRRKRNERARMNEVSTTQGKGEDLMDREDRLSGDPWQKSQIFLGQRVHVQDPEVVEPEIAKTANRVHVPENVLRPSRLDMDKIRPKEIREMSSVIGLSNQFREERRASDKNVEDLPQPCTSESTYMHHDNSDDVTFWAAVKKRLRFADPEKNMKKLRKKTTLGNYMATEFLRRVKISPVRNQLLLDQCRDEFERVKLKKSKQLIENHSSRSDPDGKMDEVKVFLKTQLCTKFEKRFCEGKAGQTIACFHHNVLNHFSPYCRYMEKKITEALPDYVYIHQKKNFETLDQFVRERFRGGVCVESDYEAYDASQDATVLAFEIAIMEHMQMDPQFIDDYRLLKCTLGSKLGSFAIMRFTGEFSTFLFNTMANIAFTNMRYIWRREVILFAGDDMCAFGDLPVDYRHNDFFKKLTLKAKVNRVETPMFCGWRLSTFGIFKEPRLILDRLNICKEKETLVECINSYFEEFIFSYNQGFRIELMMDCDQMAAHYTCTRKFLRHQSRLSYKNRMRLREAIPSASEYDSS